TFYFSPSRGGNSNVTLPLASITRYAGKGLPALEMNLPIKSVLRVTNNFCAWAGSIGCCKISRLILNRQGLESACDFSHRYPASVSKTLPPHFGHLPSGVLPVKSIFGIGSLGAPPLAFVFRSRGANSNAVPPSLITRNASNLRLVFLETNPLSKSVLPSASNFFTC